MLAKAISFPRTVERPSRVKVLLEKNSVTAVHTAGDLNTVVQSVAAPEHATVGSLIFVQTNLDTVAAGSVVVTTELIIPSGGVCIVTPTPRRWFVDALKFLFPSPEAKINEHAVIAQSARIATGVTIGPFSVVGEHVSIGEGTVIGNHVIIHDGCRVGAHSIVQDHTVIGSVGIAYYRDAGDDWYSLKHLGIVSLGDNVEVGAHCVIVRGILHDTIIEYGTKIGNFVNVGHNAVVGRNCWITSGAVICGRAYIEDDVKIAAGACIRDKIKIGRGAQIGLGTVVTKDVIEGAKLFGNPGRQLRTMGPL
jgi:UDP-3-O-[3-hydroxymyristoyl] glucosamine N-acyltransferase